MDEVQNPYRPGAGSPPPALLGRDALIDQFGVAVRRAMAGKPGKALMPVGLRGVGKTVLLGRFIQIAQLEGVTTGFLESTEDGDFRQQLASRLRQMLLSLGGGQRSPKLLRALRILKTFTYQLPDGSKIALDVDPLLGHADSGDLTEDVTELLVAAGEAAAERLTGVVLAIDEVQYLQPDDFAATITAIHRTTQLNLPVLLVGAGLPQLPRLAGEAKSYAERLFDFPELTGLEPADAADALQIPAEAEGASFDDDAISLVITATRGYPYFIQEWGYRAWNHAHGPRIKARDIEQVTPLILDHLDRTFFRVRYDRLTSRERGYLHAMATLGPGPHRSSAIAARLDVTVESVAPRRAALISKGMVYAPARGLAAFTVPLFDQFLLRQHNQA